MSDDDIQIPSPRDIAEYKPDVREALFDIVERLKVPWDANDRRSGRTFQCPKGKGAAEEIGRRLMQAGWLVKTTSDQRDGDYMTVSMPQSPSGDQI